MFRDRVVLVTGGGSGIGRAAALVFARRGARVALADVVEAGGAETVAAVAGQGGDAFSVCADVAEDAQVKAVVEATIARFGRLDFGVFSAGIGGARAPTPDYPEDAWRRVLDVNLTGVWLCMRHAIPAILESGGGAIVNVASVAGLVGFPLHSAYAAAKHGVVGLTRSAALEYARRGLRVNAVCPGFTRTPMVEQDMLDGDASLEAELVRRVPMRRLGTPEEVAEAIAYLCSDAAGFVTGQTLTLDGGVTAA